MAKSRKKVVALRNFRLLTAKLFCPALKITVKNELNLLKPVCGYYARLVLIRLRSVAKKLEEERKV